MNRALGILMAVAVVVVAGVVGLGFYRGWFGVTSTAADGRASSTFTVDTDKIRKDRQEAIGNVPDLGRKAAPLDASGTDASEADEATHDGTVVSIRGDKLVMAGPQGQQHSYTLAAETVVTCDGEAGQSADLKIGMRIRVTTNIEEPDAATRIEALDDDRDFKEVG